MLTVTSGFCPFGEELGEQEPPRDQRVKLPGPPSPKRWLWGGRVHLPTLFILWGGYTPAFPAPAKSLVNLETEKLVMWRPLVSEDRTAAL